MQAQRVAIADAVFEGAIHRTVAARGRDSRHGPEDPESSGFDVIVAGGRWRRARRLRRRRVRRVGRAAYRAHGSRDDVWSAADLVLKVRCCSSSTPALGRYEADAHSLKAGAALRRLHLARAGTRTSSTAPRGAQAALTALAMDAVPRITRAQKMDALSAMANIGGLPRRHRGGRTALRALLPGADDRRAAGRVKPGAGARSVSRRRRRGGSRRSRRRRERSARQVRAFDTRAAACAEQVESLGGAVRRVQVRAAGVGRGAGRLRQGDESSEAYLGRRAGAHRAARQGGRTSS